MLLFLLSVFFPFAEVTDSASCNRKNSSEAKQLSKWFTAVKFGKEDSYKIAGQVLYPLLDNFTFDKAPGDRDITIKVNQDKSAITFADWIKAIFRYIFNLFRGVFYLK